LECRLVLMLNHRNSIQFLLASLLVFAIVLVSAAPPTRADSLNDGISLYNKRDYKKAIDTLTRSATANPTSPTPLYYQAMAYSQMGDTVKARALYFAITKRFPESPEAKYASVYLNKVTGAGVATTTVTTTTTTTTTSASAQSGQRSRSSSTNAAPIGDMTSFSAANATSEDLGKLPDSASIPFSRGSGGHLFVDTQINGRTIRMMFDTGASTCLIGKNQLEAAGVMDNVIKGQHTQMGGVGNATNSAAPMIVDLRVGGIQRHMPIMVQDRFDLPPLLGQTFYNGYQYDIDNQSGVIRFTKKSAARNSMGYDAIEVPFQTVGNNLVVMTQVNGHQCPMYFDTGAAMNCFSMGTYLGLGLSIPQDATMAMVGGVGGAAPAYAFNVRSMKLGSIEKNNIPIYVMTTGGPPLPLLGQPFLRDRRFVIDNDKKVIRFSR
jgi:clan AA aspartic protease (TIGR02281 family)